MRIIRTKTALIVGAIALAIGVGAAGILAAEDVREAFAQTGGNDIEGTIESLPASGLVGTWQVAGRTVTVTDTTEIDQEGQQLAVGTWVEVDGVAQADGSILASEIEVDQPDNDDDDDNGVSASGARTSDDDD
jgi:hypothetical protein